MRGLLDTKFWPTAHTSLSVTAATAFKVPSTDGVATWVQVDGHVLPVLGAAPVWPPVAISGIVTIADRTTSLAGTDLAGCRISSTLPRQQQMIGEG
jgi:hypothetical protein